MCYNKCKLRPAKICLSKPQMYRIPGQFPIGEKYLLSCTSPTLQVIHGKREFKIPLRYMTPGLVTCPAKDRKDSKVQSALEARRGLPAVLHARSRDCNHGHGTIFTATSVYSQSCTWCLSCARDTVSSLSPGNKAIRRTDSLCCLERIWRQQSTYCFQIRVPLLQYLT